MFSELSEIKRIALRTHEDFGIGIFDGPGVCRVNIKLTYPLSNVSLKYTLRPRIATVQKSGWKHRHVIIFTKRELTPALNQNLLEWRESPKGDFSKDLSFFEPHFNVRHIMNNTSNHITRRWNLESMKIYTEFYDIFWPGFTPFRQNPIPQKTQRWYGASKRLSTYLA